MILILVSSQKKNMELANLFKEYLDNGATLCEIIDLVALDLPLYTSKVENDRPPEVVFDLEKKLKNADALVFVAPEYNGSLPPVLNNSISWISRTGTDWRSSFNGKPALIATHSGGGGSQVLMAMRLQLSYLGVNVMGRQILTHKGKDLNHESMVSVLEELKIFSR
jgi:chromate reductase, NAD(P)H dehydrogenase (quinone)